MSIKLQNELQLARIEIEQLEAKVVNLQQVVDALTSNVEKRAREADEDRAVVKKLQEFIGAQTMKGSVHGTAVRRGAEGRNAAGKQTS